MMWVLGVACWLLACVAMIQALHIGALQGELDTERRKQHIAARKHEPTCDRVARREHR